MIADPLGGCLAQVIALAPRVPELLDLVLPSILEQRTHAASRGRSALAFWAWRLASQIGGSLRRQANLVDFGRYDELFLGFLDSTPDDVVDRVGLTCEPLPLPREWEPLDFSGDDETHARIMEATATVVGISGIHGTSMLRVGRAAKLSPGTITARIASRSDLIVEAFRALVNGVVNQNFGVINLDDFGRNFADPYALALVGSLSPERVIWRRFRTEMLLACIAMPEIREPLEEALEESDAVLRTFMVRTGISDEVATALVSANQSLTIGASVLEALNLNIRDMDHRIPVRWIQTQLFASSA